MPLYRANPFVSSTPAAGRHRRTMRINGEDAFIVEQDDDGVYFGLPGGFRQVGGSFWLDGKPELPGNPGGLPKPWMRSLICAERVDGADIAAWCFNGEIGDYQDKAAGETIVAFYGKAYGGDTFTPVGPYYTAFDGVSDTAVSGGTEEGPYTWSFGTSETDVACYVYTTGSNPFTITPFSSAGLQVKDVDYTVDMVGKELTFIAGHEPSVGETVRIIRRRNRAGSEFQGRAGGMYIHPYETPTDTARGGLVYIALPREAQTRERPSISWPMTGGRTILWGRATYEDVTNGEYPDRIGLEEHIRGCQGSINPGNYLGGATLTILTSDYANEAGLGLFKSTDPTQVGVLWGLDFSNGLRTLQTMSGGVKTLQETLSLTTGQRKFGLRGGTVAALQLSPVASAVNGFEILSATTGNSPVLQVVGTGNIDAVIKALGAGNVSLYSNDVIAFRAQGEVNAASYIRLVVRTATNNPYIEIISSDTNRGLQFRPKGNATIDILTNGLSVAGSAVVGTRKTGWTVATGTATRTAFDTATVTTEQLAQRVKALIDDLHGTAGHGLIGT